MSLITINDVENVKYSGDITIDSLIDSGLNWNFLTPTKTVLYYTFDTTNFSDDQITTKISPFNAFQQTAAQSILNYTRSITGINFQNATSGKQADIYFANTDLDDDSVSGLATSSFNYSANDREVITEYEGESHIYLDNVEWEDENTKPLAGTQGYETLLHEIGHALGLKHPFKDAGDSFDTPVLSTAEDNTNNTVMSYTSKGDYKTEFQRYDLKALKWLYGTDGLGGESYNTPTDSVIDNEENDDDDESTVEDLHLIGTNDADKLEGEEGNDTLDGGAGRDTLVGADGDDVYIIDNGRDQIIEIVENGDDSVLSSVSYTLSKNVENLTLQGTSNINGTGNELDNALVGNDGKNQLKGMAGDDYLSGGKGNDKLTGGAGYDTFEFHFEDYDFMGDFAPRAINVDTITDFKKGVDSIQLSEEFNFSSENFVVVKNLKLFSGDENFIYDSTKRTLYFDIDGNDSDYSPTAFIKFSGKVNLDSDDFEAL
jgi:Ca2+-binding RTX toxin-like protein